MEVFVAALGIVISLISVASLLWSITHKEEVSEQRHKLDGAPLYL